MLSLYRGLRREIYVLCFGRIVTSLGGMIWPMMTMILNQKMGLGAGQISMLMAVASLLMMPVNLIGGKLADRFNKKFIIVVCDLISIVCYLICGFIPLSFFSLGMIYVASICQNMEYPSYNALIADLSKTKDRERAYSLQYLAGNLGLVLSPTIAGILFRNYLWLSFLISGISIACSTVLIIFFVRDIRPEEENGEADAAQAVYQDRREAESLWKILKERSLLLVFVAMYGIYSGVYQQANILMPLDLGRIHGEQGAVIYGTVFSVNCIIVVVFTPIITKLFYRSSEGRKMLISHFLVLLGFGLFVLFPGIIPLYYISMMIFTWGEIFMMLAWSPYLSRRIPASHRGRINGLIAVSQAVFIAVIQMMAGQLYDHLGTAYAWGGIFLLGAVMILLTFILIVRDRKEFAGLYRE